MEKTKTILVDLHQDLASHLRENPNKKQTDLFSLSKNTDIFFGSVFFPNNPQTEKETKELEKLIEKDIKWYTGLESNAKTPFKTIANKKDLEDVLNKKQKGVLIHLEGADVLNPTNEFLLEKWKKLGLKSVGLVWNNTNNIGTPASANRPKESLTEFGRRIVKKLNDLGIIIDCAHLNQAGFYDVLNLSKTPPMVSHGNSYGLCPDPRNFTDRQIKDLTEIGGIIGVFFSAKFVRKNAPADLDYVAEHIAYITSLVGAENVAIGSDFGGITSGLIPKLSRVQDLPNLKNTLLKKGFSQSDINKIFGLNAVKYLESVFK